MKTKPFFGILILFLSTICFVSCNDDNSNKWYDSMSDGGPFYTGSVLRFYYVDEEGNDLINPEDFSTLPVTSLKQLDSQPVIESYDRHYNYNNEYNHIQYNEYTGLYNFFTFAFGDSRQSNYTFYVYYKGVADRMDVTFQYQDYKVNSGQDYISSTISWSVNGVEVYNIEKPSMRKYVYLVKKSDGTTSVVIDEEN
ncbi:hypothetical protein [Bacteroides sp. 51]|uniref:hypothetical protein n=1 Tax=Bacteroides sp. 51 TaxID=2302938 RepID=UPI0013CF95B8|nr:hypothetical protein [Bacteroides sp. 51]NDV81450.1 hypothetical protein [Bacteroides sp. 51]